ncbi:MAG: hypothetical protein AAF514_14770 [Verrucomicrobiota bacterium]
MFEAGFSEWLGILGIWVTAALLIGSLIGYIFFYDQLPEIWAEVKKKVGIESTETPPADPVEDPGLPVVVTPPDAEASAQ